MSQSVPTLCDAASADVHAFAQVQGVSEQLPAVVQMTQRVFPGVPVTLEIDDDPEIPDDRHIVLVVRPTNMDVDTALELRWRWHSGLFACCPAPLAPVFRLGLELSE